jgi:hypothetical protein
MRTRALKKQAAGALIGLLASVAVAAGQPPEGRGPGARSSGRPTGARAEEVREAMEQTVIARMKVALHLTSEQEATVIPRMHLLMQARRDHASKRRDAVARLRALLQDGTAGDREIGRALQDVRGIDEGFRGREEGLRDAIDHELSSRQQARMMFFEARLRRVMQRQLREDLGGGPPGPGPRRGPGAAQNRRPGRPPAPPAEDDDGSSGTPEDEP